MLRVPIIPRPAGQQSKYCPYCHSDDVRRSHRQGILEKSLGRVLSLYPYRCEACDGRYFILGRRKLSGPTSGHSSQLSSATERDGDRNVCDSSDSTTTERPGRGLASENHDRRTGR